MGRYQWAPQKAGSGRKEEPLKEDDDPPDCVRYMVQELDGRPVVPESTMRALANMRVW